MKESSIEPYLKSGLKPVSLFLPSQKEGQEAWLSCTAPVVFSGRPGHLVKLKGKLSLAHSLVLWFASASSFHFNHSKSERGGKKQPVFIQLAGVSWEEEVRVDQRHYESELHVKGGYRFGVLVLRKHIKGKRRVNNKGQEKKMHQVW